jgi:hypothetical protein
VSGGACDGRRLPLNWAKTIQASTDPVVTLRRMAPKKWLPAVRLTTKHSPSRSRAALGVASRGCQRLLDIAIDGHDLVQAGEPNDSGGRRVADCKPRFGPTSGGQALSRIRARRPIAGPNPGFLAQLQRLWP